MAVRVPPGPIEAEILLMDLVRSATSISVEGELELKVAYASNVEENDRLEMMMVGVKNTAVAALTQQTAADCALGFDMWDPPLAGLTQRYACAVIVDRFKNICLAGYPDPVILKTKGWRMALGRHMPAGTVAGKGDLHGQPQVLSEDELKDCPGDYSRMEMIAAIALALRIYANPGEISEGDPWARLKKFKK